MEDVILPIRVVVEGITDEPVIRRILEFVKLPCGIVYDQQGKGNLLQNLANYNQAAWYSPWLVVADLDRDADCAPIFIQDKLPHPAKGMCFRVAVRAIESWLLADTDNLAAYLKVNRSQMPENPDAENDPKITLVNLARKSRKKDIREDMVPREGSGSRVGPGYTGRVIDFCHHYWNPEAALPRSSSFQRCVKALQKLKTWPPV